MRAKRLYRAIAHYKDGTTVTRHFQTKKARDAWAKNRSEGYSEYVGDYDHINGFRDEQEAIPPAQYVECAVSEPVVFLVDYPEGLRAVNDES
jgi:hypothetical protein